AAGLVTPAARAATVLVISDPQSSTKPVTLVEHALVEEFRRQKDVQVIVSGGIAKQAKVGKLLKEAEALRRTARSKFDQLELDAALRQYTKALQKLEKTVTLTDDLRPFTDTLMMLSAVHL